MSSPKKTRRIQKRPGRAAQGSLHRPCSALVFEWRRRAEYAFRSADKETSMRAQRLVRHGATCYANCAIELQDVLDGKKGAK